MSLKLEPCWNVDVIRSKRVRVVRLENFISHFSMNIIIYYGLSSGLEIRQIAIVLCNCKYKNNNYNLLRLQPSIQFNNDVFKAHVDILGVQCSS